VPNIPALPYDLPEQYPERQQQKHQRKNKQKGRHKGHNSIHPTTSEDNLNYLNSQYNPDTTQTDDNPFGIQPTILQVRLAKALHLQHQRHSYSQDKQ
jgi:hypothetical protein